MTADVEIRANKRKLWHLVKETQELLKELTKTKEKLAATVKEKKQVFTLIP